MQVRYASSKLKTLAIGNERSSRYSDELIRSYRKMIGALEAAVDDRDLYAMKSFHFEKLKGDRQHQRSLRLNKQFRLIIEITGDAVCIAMVIGIEDYH